VVGIQNHIVRRAIEEGIAPLYDRFFSFKIT